MTLTMRKSLMTTSERWVSELLLDSYKVNEVFCIRFSENRWVLRNHCGNHQAHKNTKSLIVLTLFGNILKGFLNASTVPLC